MLHPKVDAPDVAGDQDGRVDPTPRLQSRSADPHDRQRDGRRSDETSADDEQFEDPEHAGGHDRHDPGDDGDDALPVQHVDEPAGERSGVRSGIRPQWAIGTGTASNTSLIASAGERCALRSARIMMRWLRVASPTALTSSGVA